MRTSNWIGLFLATVLMLHARGESAADLGHLRPVELHCEYVRAPIGLGTDRPRLSWQFQTDRRAESQSAYRVLVASTAQGIAEGAGDLWDSGKVMSGESILVEYAGKRLESRQRCYWKVMSWDRDGNAGSWSEISEWEMGLLTGDDWSAEWIEAGPSRRPVQIEQALYYTVDGTVRKDVTEVVAGHVGAGKPVVAANDALGGDPARNVVKRLSVVYRLDGERREADIAENQTVEFGNTRIPLIRRSFVVSKPVARARVYVTALGVYELYLNGVQVGDHRLAPGWTDYRKRVPYQTFDVSEQVVQGANAIGGVVAPGWFSGRAGLFHITKFYGDTPALLAQLELVYTDGTTERIVSDGSWRRRDGPIVAADLMDGETYDARHAIQDWCGVAFDDAEWSPVVVREEKRTLVGTIDPPVRVLFERPATSVTQPSKGQWVFDLGQNIVGVARVRVRAARGTVVTIRYGEMLNPDGTLYTANLRGAACIDRYTCAGGAEEIWEPRFTFHGFRYVELSGLRDEPRVEAVTGIVLGSDTPITGQFSCSDTRLNQLFSNIVWGQRGNYLSIPTDCPQRDERMGWMADTQVFVPTAAFIADIATFMTKWMIDVRDSQREDGAHSDVAPVTRGLAYGTPAWADAGTIVPWTMYQMYGDIRILEDNIESMMRWVDWCRVHSTGFIRDRDRGNDYGDWLAIGEHTPKDLIGTAYFARSADIVSQALQVLGRREDATRYAVLFDQIRSVFNTSYIDADGRIKGDTQCGYAIAIRFGLLDTDHKEMALRHLIRRIEANGWRLSTGFVGVGNLLPVLSEHGRADVAYRLLFQDAFPSWLFSVEHGATTIWERWDGWTPETGPHPDISMNSFNHYSLGSCGEWLFTDVAGITPDPSAPGLRRFAIRPRLESHLTHAEATYYSVRGEIVSKWSLVGDALTLNVTIPPNTRATVIIPSHDGGSVLESGIYVDLVKDIVVQHRRADSVQIEVGSGMYQFTTTRPTQRSGNPVLPGWYADPEVAVFGDRFWIYPTYSASYDKQVFFDAFSSPDLVHWNKHPKVLERSAVAWAKRAMWAPAAIEHDSKYYLFFSANDIQKNSDTDGVLGGIGVAVADSPSGPFRDHIGTPLIDAFHNGAQPIDQFVFRDTDGRHYMYYGGWRHCNVARLNPDFRGFEPFDDGTMFREITPDGYVEGPFVFIRNGKYYFMWSEGGWTGPDYSVAYAIADSPLGPFKRVGKILQQDQEIATGAGHHSILNIPGTDEYYIVYHRRPLGETDGNHRVVCIDRLAFAENGLIEPVKMTFEGVNAVRPPGSAGR